jgi:type IV pilus assembly protein PilF
MKLRNLMVALAWLLLQSCHDNNLQEAASYNTQLGLAYLKQGDRARDSPEVNASMAWFLEQSGETENARIYYRKAMAAAPGKGTQLNNYGAFLCRRGQYRQADTYFLQAVRDPGYEHVAGAYENAGLCAAAIPDYARAIRYFGKALAQDPSRKQSLYEWVNIEMKLGHEDKALSCLQAYQALTWSDRALLALAAEAAHKSGQRELEADYRLRLQRWSQT